MAIIKDIDANLADTYRACNPGIKEQIVDLAMNNAGIRDAAKALHISINAVIRVFKKNFSPFI